MTTLPTRQPQTTAHSHAYPRVPGWRTNSAMPGALNHHSGTSPSALAPLRLPITAGARLPSCIVATAPSCSCSRSISKAPDWWDHTSESGAHGGSALQLQLFLSLALYRNALLFSLLTASAPLRPHLFTHGGSPPLSTSTRRHMGTGDTELHSTFLGQPQSFHDSLQAYSATYSTSVLSFAAVMYHGSGGSSSSVNQEQGSRGAEPPVASNVSNTVPQQPQQPRHP
ncbi:hypothetical protein CALVIDRAFT_40195 [Calocera viscosa TUFC12733]|uniref:Uncharacterized protein n=1 Tax=Calocera viscosa (strain TUFC12733) TaxID=1330018 RepID=A0A167P1Q0_CALVF|nr:hypothetical protein CALVIDRAFT_40195 [Calocera viscosa TUFC12733]